MVFRLFVFPSSSFLPLPVNADALEGIMKKRRTMKTKDKNVISREPLCRMEEAQQGFNENARHKCSVDTDTDLESSLDCAEDSSCSTDFVHHTVKADLYGTDRDPSYIDDRPSPPIQQQRDNTDVAASQKLDANKVSSAEENKNFCNCSSPVVAREGSCDVNNNNVLQRTNSPLEQGLVLTDTSSESKVSGDLEEAGPKQVTPVSFGGLFNKTSPSNTQSDIEIYRQSYVESDSGQQICNTNQHLLADSGFKPEEQQQDITGIQDRPLPHYQAHHQQVDVPVGQQSFQDTTDIRPQQFRVLSQQDQFTSPSGFQSFTNDSEQQHQYHPADKISIDTDRQFLSPASYRRNFTEEQNIAAEQLASELVKTYGGQNSHRISEILGGTGGQVEGCGYGYEGFERGTTINAHGQQYSTPQMINDVLSSPQQFSALDDGYRENGATRFGNPGHNPSQDSFSNHPRVNSGLQGSITYNNVHVHGGKWTTSTMYSDSSESPFPTQGHNLAQVNIPSNQHIEAQVSRPNFSVLTSPNLAGHESGEITKTTFTSREHMEMHLSDNLKNKHSKQMGSGLSDVDYSSIYPSRDFIERATCLVPEPRSEMFNKHRCGGTLQPLDLKQKQSDPGSVYKHLQECCRPPKKRRISKYNTDDIRVPPQTPMFDDMLHKYTPAGNRDEAHGSRHKYFVVNPSDVTNMSSKTLVTKYIDFLIGENEQITEISKSVNPPVDIYVTEDMYFMDSLKFQVPFPSRKFVEWVSSFYPRLNFFEMKFKGHQPSLPNRTAILKTDPRPTQQILEDTFYYFQRELMNMKG